MTNHAERLAEGDAAEAGTGDADSVRDRGKSPVRLLAALVSRMGGVFEGLLFSSRAPQIPPVFILGPPRSGSTLFFQAFCTCFQVAYPNRLGRVLWFAPAFALWVTHRFFPAYKSDFKSKYGLSAGGASPFSLTMLNLFLSRDAYVGANDIAPRDARHIARIFGRMEGIVGGAVVSKNQRYNQWVRFLADLFPDAIFLVMSRKPVGLSLSLLRARYEVAGSFSSWYLLKPLSYQGEAEAEPEREVAWQLQGIMEDLRQDMDAIGPERFAVIEYEAFCRAPRAYMGQVADFLNERGVALTWREGEHLSSPFESVSTRTDNLTEAQVLAVESACREIFPEDKLPTLPCVTIGYDGTDAPKV